MIYSLLIGFVIIQFSIVSKQYFAELSLWFLASCSFNVSWILVWHYQLIYASALIMLLLLFSLTKIFLLLQHQAFTSWGEKILIKLPFTIYLAWICVATIANISALLVSLSWNGGILTPSAWTITMICTAGVIGIFIAERYRVPAFLLVLIWAFFGIYSKWNATENQSISNIALIELILLGILFLIFQFRFQRKSVS
ncbi:MAG: hypothetical protein JNL53_06755 [Cyclobacteriaceae bacterium]|nr:hypothetical protein [Cyclobacteriaceae bacterium]